MRQKTGDHDGLLEKIGEALAGVGKKALSGAVRQTQHNELNEHKRREQQPAGEVLMFLEKISAPVHNSRPVQINNLKMRVKDGSAGSVPRSDRFYILCRRIMRMLSASRTL